MRGAWIRVGLIAGALGEPIMSGVGLFSWKQRQQRVVRLPSPVLEGLAVA